MKSLERIVILTDLGLAGSYIINEIMKKKGKVFAVIVDRNVTTGKSFFYKLPRFLWRKYTSLRGNNEDKERRRFGIEIENWTIPIYFISNMNKRSELLDALKPDLLIVIGGRKLSKKVISTAKKGTINFHGGILPNYRGLDSTYHAMKNKDYDNIGATIHFMSENIDSGDIIMQKRISPIMNRVKESDFKIIKECSHLIVDSIEQIENGNVKRIEQDSRESNYYRKMGMVERICFLLSG